MYYSGNFPGWQPLIFELRFATYRGPLDTPSSVRPAAANEGEKKCVDSGAKAKVYVSMENRMACGIGACLVCTCKTKSGNKRACKDGPVMEGWEVFGE